MYKLSIRQNLISFQITLNIEYGKSSQKQIAHAEINATLFQSKSGKVGINFSQYLTLNIQKLHTYLHIETCKDHDVPAKPSWYLIQKLLIFNIQHLK